MVDIQLIGTKWIYQRILDYCEDRVNGIGGYYRQTSYRKDYFHIFTDAEIGGYCGNQAIERHRKRCEKLKRNKPSFKDYVVTAEGIQEFLPQHWLQGKNNKAENTEMISDLCEWWDAWVFASSGHYPRDYGSRKSRRRVRKSLERWIQIQE
jgi:hypothetical protein